MICASYSFSPVRLVTPLPFCTKRSSGVSMKEARDLDEVVHEVAVQAGRRRDQHVVAPAGVELAEREELRPAAVPVRPARRTRRNDDGAAAGRRRLRPRARSCRGTRSTDSRAPSPWRRAAASRAACRARCRSSRPSTSSRAGCSGQTFANVSAGMPSQARARSRDRAVSRPDDDRASGGVERIRAASNRPVARASRSSTLAPLVQDVEQAQERARVRRTHVGDAAARAARGAG